MKTLRGKCPRCCPDGGACFEIFSDVKKCTNCHLEIPRRKYTKSGTVTPCQQKTIDKILATFGGEIEKLEMIGRKVWITIENKNRNWIFGDMVYGTISVNGHFSLTLSGMGNPPKITDWIGVSVYLRNEPVHQKKEKPIDENKSVVVGNVAVGGNPIYATKGSNNE